MGVVCREYAYYVITVFWIRKYVYARIVPLTMFTD
jgi:hypothetical protein